MSPATRHDDHDDSMTDRMRKIIEEGRRCSEESRIKRLEGDVEDHSDRIREAEKLLADGKTSFALLEANSTAMNAGIEKINTTLSRLNWTVILAVIGALLSFVIKEKKDEDRHDDDHHAPSSIPHPVLPQRGP